LRREARRRRGFRRLFDSLAKSRGCGGGAKKTPQKRREPVRATGRCCVGRGIVVCPGFMDGITIIQALILGLIEGLTEFIPVSSTGHLILASSWLNLSGTPEQKAAVDAFDIVIQAGAIAACALHYRRKLIGAVTGLFSKDMGELVLSLRLVTNLLFAFVPIAVVGLLFRKTLKAWLFNPTTVAVALVVGGVAMIAADRFLATKAKIKDVDEISMHESMKVGFWQCLALIPGTSRSMSTILGGMTQGMTARTAADFSFLLSVPVLGAATVYELLKEWQGIIEHIGVAPLVVGLISSFFVGWLSIVFFLKLLERVGLAPFGYYRIVAGVVVAITLG
jgi:undecaprenyl-diphosphatase